MMNREGLRSLFDSNVTNTLQDSNRGEYGVCEVSRMREKWWREAGFPR